jgi:hypothetical protein
MKIIKRIEFPKFEFKVICPNCKTSQIVSVDGFGYWSGNCFYCKKEFSYLEPAESWEPRISAYNFNKRGRRL